MSAELHTVHVRINDAATGQPTPVRVHFSTPDGKYYAPLGRLTDFALEDYEDVGGNLLHGKQRYAYIDGTCETRLPAGPIQMEIHKGPEYTPRFIQATLAPGKMALRHEIKRWTDLRHDRWYSGDIRAHGLTPHAALLEAAAEDLAVANLLVWERIIWNYIEADLRDVGPILEHRKSPAYSAFCNILAFSGRRSALEVPGHLVVVNTHNRHRPLGSLALLNCHRLVWPLSIDVIASPEEWSDWALADWADQCHRKGGLVVWTEMDTADFEDLGWLLGEPLADLLLGKIDAVEVTTGCDWDERRQIWYRLLNCGCRVPLVGGSGKVCNTVQLGSLRTYARLQPGEEFTYQTWIEAIRAGRTFVSNGPLMSFTVNGQDPGAVLDLPSLDQPVRVNLGGRSIFPFDQLELVLNGEVILQLEPSGSPASASFEGSVNLPSAGWLAARCQGSLELPVGNRWTQQVSAHSSPIYVQVGGQSSRVDEDCRAFLLGHLDKMAAWAERRGGPGNGHPTGHILEILQSARKILVERGQV